MQFTVKQLIVYRKQIERMQTEDMYKQANAIGLAFNGDKSKGGEN